ncbi:MAG TPA: bacteriocin fulvocin C-related protein [Thermoanaerobaculia bacterium]|nr:bacteriocin fulvocin C-related protein [Thermoanaerobaculia bacterium]
MAQPTELRPVDAGAEYQTIRSLPRNEGKAHYYSLPDQAHKDVWTQHLVTFLKEHPELSEDQRDVILQGIGLLATGILDISDTDPRWRTEVGDPVARVVARAKLLMSPELVAEAFYTLEGSRQQRPSPRRGDRKTPVTNGLVDCDCATMDSHCFWYDLVCTTGGPHFCIPLPSWKCGPFYTYMCDGRCL